MIRGIKIMDDGKQELWLKIAEKSVVAVPSLQIDFNDKLEEIFKVAEVTMRSLTVHICSLDQKTIDKWEKETREEQTEEFKKITEKLQGILDIAKTIQIPVAKEFMPIQVKLIYQAVERNQENFARMSGPSRVEMLKDLDKFIGEISAVNEELSKALAALKHDLVEFIKSGDAVQKLIIEDSDKRLQNLHSELDKQSINDFLNENSNLRKNIRKRRQDIITILMKMHSASECIPQLIDEYATDAIMWTKSQPIISETDISTVSNRIDSEIFNIGLFARNVEGDDYRRDWIQNVNQFILDIEEVLTKSKVEISILNSETIKHIASLLKTNAMIKDLPNVDTLAKSLVQLDADYSVYNIHIDATFVFDFNEKLFQVHDESKFCKIDETPAKLMDKVVNAAMASVEKLRTDIENKGNQFTTELKEFLEKTKIIRDLLRRIKYIANNPDAKDTYKQQQLTAIIEKILPELSAASKIINQNKSLKAKRDELEKLMKGLIAKQEKLCEDLNKQLKNVTA